MAQGQAKKEKRAYSVAHYVLGITADGKAEKVGLCSSVEGGNRTTEVHKYQVGGWNGMYKQVPCKAKIADVSVKVGMATDTFYKWIMESVNGNAVRKNVTISAGDFQFVERARRELSQVVISSLKIPQLKADNKDAVQMTVSMAAEEVVDKEGDGSNLHADIGGLAEKLFAAANFRLTLDDFTDSTKRVVSMEGFEIKIKPLEHQTGGMRHTLKIPGFVEWPEMTFSIPEPDAWPIVKAFEARVEKGEPQKPARGTGTLELIDQQGVALFTMKFGGVDFCKIEQEKSDAGSQDFRLTKVTFTVEAENTEMAWTQIPAADLE